MNDLTVENLSLSYADLQTATEEDKAVLLDLKQALESAKNMANIVRTFGDCLLYTSRCV